LNERSVARLTGKRAVEINDVEASTTGIEPSNRNRKRIAREDGDVVHPTLF